MTKEQFTSDLSHWNSYLPLLWHALENTSGDVIELGMGDGSTEKLHEYCKHNARPLTSYESDKQWFQKFERFRTERHKIEWVGHNWEILYEAHREPIGVLFSDEAPGHMRKYNVSMFSLLAQVIIAHDAEESNDHGYRFSWVKPLFKYYKLHEFKGASTAAFSNFIDVSKWEI
jgi:hypothetical protein